MLTKEKIVLKSIAYNQYMTIDVQQLLYSA